MKWYKIKIFRIIAGLFGVKFWTKADIDRINKQSEQLASIKFEETK